MKLPEFLQKSPSRGLWRPVALAIFLAHQAVSLGQPSGSVMAWGNNSALQSQVPPSLGNVAAIAAGGSHSLALKTDGTVAGWGFNVFGQATPPAGLANVVAISAGDSYSLALKANGTVAVWGNHPAAPGGLTNVTAIAAGFTHSLALKSDGTVVSWGSQTVVPGDLTNAVAIAAGNGQSVALRADGTVVAWGDNAFGKIDVPPGLVNVIAVAAGQDHCLALQRSGTIIAWGSNAKGQTDVPAAVTNAVAISAGALHNLALRGNGSLAGWGDNTFNQAVVPGLSNFFAIAAGGSHSLAIRSDGSPIILRQPLSQTIIITKSVTFEVMAIGAQPLKFRWQHNGADVIGATNALLTLSNVQMSDAGSYTVVITNSIGSVTSATAVLTPVGAAPFITAQPQDQHVLCGEAAAFYVAADGSPPFTYQWQFAGVPIAEATDTAFILTNVSTENAGAYTVVITGIYGSVTSAVAVLSVDAVPPVITSPLSVLGKQGQAFNYTITGLHTPVFFGASGLPPGLVIDPLTGLISGVPLESGTFGATISAANGCASSSETLVFTFSSSIPVITSVLIARGQEGAAFSYRIRGSDAPTGFDAQNPPLGLIVNRLTGFITGKPVYAGDFFSTISATNVWGTGSATLHFIFTNALASGLSITNVETTYSSPYLLDFQFSLKDDNDPSLGHAVITDPRLLSVTCLEAGQPISTSETAMVIQRAATKLFKSVLVLDFTQSIASLSNGDTNSDGISDAVDAMVAGAQDFVDQQQPDSQVGVWEFHREDLDPQRVAGLTTDKTLVDNAIAGIWTNYVQNFPAASRAWDALTGAIADLGPTNRDEQHFVIFVSDGKDESSISTANDVIRAATNGNVKLFCIGFGAELDPVILQTMTTATDGRYYDAQALGGLTAAFDQIAKDLNGRYILRWATLKRSTNSFMPSFQITYQGMTANSPDNPVATTTNIDNTTTPPTTNIVTTTNFIIGPYVPTQHTGNVTVGSLRLAANASIQPRSITLRAFYVPRYIRQIRVHYRANWPCTPTLQSTNLGEILYGWSLSETNDGAAGKWLQITSPNPQSLSNSITFGALGPLIKFTFRDMLDATNAFGLFALDNTVYTNTGNQSFVLDTTNLYITNYPALPFGTPVPWLIAHGFTNNFVAAELSDPDGDGALTWQEYQANTDPRDASSKFAIHAIARAFDGRYQLTFSTALARTYRVESSADLLNWQLLQNNIQGTGSDVTVTDTRYLPGLTQIFYRVAVY